MINEKPRKKAEDRSKLYFPDRNTPSTRKNNRKTPKDGNHKIYKLISKQPSALGMLKFRIKLYTT